MAVKVKKKARFEAPEERRRQLIDATVTCIASHGISGTTLRKVSETAGLSLGLVNFHFANKDTLLHHTLLALAEEHRNLWKQKVMNTELTPVEKIYAIVEAQFHPKICSRKKLAVWFAFFGEAHHRKVYREITAGIDAERMETCRTLLQGIAEEQTLFGKPDEIAAALEALFDGTWLNILLYPEVFKRAHAERHVKDYLGLVFARRCLD